MTKILGLDLGTNSIGLSLRNLDSDNFDYIYDQLENFGSVIFPSGVGTDKSGEFSYAAERTKHRSARRLNQSRRYRIWATLKVLIENGLCPLSIDDLIKWKTYDKSKGMYRKYPIEAVDFEKWVRLDFGNGIEYSSPYQLRAELVTRQFNFDLETDRYKLGRALYHIAQRRGFKSSKGETADGVKEEIADDEDIAGSMKKSEETKSAEIVKYMEAKKLLTVGQAFADLESNGVRVRGSVYSAVRSQYRDEIKKIFEFQNGLDANGELIKILLSEKKGEGSIFYKRPLRSQKGLVGNCTLEPDKPRCPISHPEYELFRAWSFVNNIKMSIDGGETKPLSMDLKKSVIDNVFMRQKNDFDFSDISKYIQKLAHKKTITFNYKDKTNVSGCPVCARLKNILGDDWMNRTIVTNKTRKGKDTKISYNYEDLWHVAFSYDEIEAIQLFAEENLQELSDEQKKQFIRLFGTVKQGYAMLSLKAIRNINRFLMEGMIYSDAVLLAKIPNILGEDRWQKERDAILDKLNSVSDTINSEKDIINITNSLIAEYKTKNIDSRQGYKDTSYILDEDDHNEILKKCISYLGEKRWDSLSNINKKNISSRVADKYQKFFADPKRDYIKLPKLGESLSVILVSEFGVDAKKANKLYHPSMIDIYKPAKDIVIDGVMIKQLGSPETGSIKNPMAMRVLHTLRRIINDMLKEGVIDEDTRIVVETARELNDKNWRAAIEAFQRRREKENQEFVKILKELFPDRYLNTGISDDDIDKVRLAYDQFDILSDEDLDQYEAEKNDKKEKKQAKDLLNIDLAKIKLWKEQGYRCIYTGKLINVSSLFDSNSVDFEHTIPRSISFDNSLSNLTICDANYNRNVKKNKIPAQLPEWETIKKRIQPWRDRIEQLRWNIDNQKRISKRAVTMDAKDRAIRKRHEYELELDYWQKKVNAFMIEDVNGGFKNSQLNDTRIITKYAFHYLKTVFKVVDVQKGQITADFRKILQIQDEAEKKDRSKHSHHAIDATVLTLIPKAVQRDRMLEMFYKICELENNGIDASSLRKQLDYELRIAKIGSAKNLTKFIEDNILIDHISKDNTLVPAKRRKRVRGKIDAARDENGKIIFERDENGELKLDKFGHPIPKPKYWIKGQCIRGRIHQDTFYGANKQAVIENGVIKRNEDGSVITTDEIKYVVRRELKFKKDENDSGFKTWDELSNVIVEKNLIPMMKSQFDEGTSFKDAVAKGIYMLKKKGDATVKINKIRHVRCYAKVSNPIKVKKQTYLSDKEYKQYYYSAMGDLYAMAKYVNESSSITEYKVYSLFDISQNKKHGLPDVPTTIMDKKNREKLKLVHCLVKDMQLIVVNGESREAIVEMDNVDLSKRLYVIEGFESDGRIRLVHHLNAQKSTELKASPINGNDFPQKIRMSINKINYLLRGVDFEIKNGNIVFE